MEQGGTPLHQPPLIPSGTIIRNTYTVDGHVASGAFADVYRVRHRYMGMQAMKVLKDGQSESQRSAGLFEAFRLARIAHPSIVRVYDGNCLEDSLGGHPYVTMELLEDGTLEDLGGSAGKRFVADLLDACDQLADALAHAHGQSPPIVHRDIKPTNVLIGRDPVGRLSVRLADFGLAVPIDTDLGFAVGHGTIAYRSPESLTGFETPASDIYSWGLTMYEAATGVFPFASRLRESQIDSTAQLIEVLRDAQTKPIDPPSYFRHAVHPAVDAIVMRALSVDHQTRIAHGAALRLATRAMRDAAEGDPSPAPSVARALHLCREPGRTTEALELLGKVLRANPERGSAYVRFLSFLRGERDRLLG